VTGVFPLLEWETSCPFHCHAGGRPRKNHVALLKGESGVRIGISRYSTHNSRHTLVGD
jgi:hypothetical protein